VESLTGKVAVVTGGGSGIGRGLCLALAGAGASVVVADIEEDAAEKVAAELAELGTRSLAVQADVADWASVQALADATYDEFGQADVVCNNAGVFLLGAVTDMVVEDWRWVLDVNVMGVVHGVHAFLPRMLEAGNGGHFVNTGSVASIGGGGPYGTSKAAVLAISEGLATDLAPNGIGVSVLLPANINSRILGAQRNRAETYGRKAAEPLGTDITNFGIDPIHVGRSAVEAILADQLYVFVFPEGWEQHLRPSAATRFDQLLAAIDRGGIAEQAAT
jgi:NAD(P)-dependent dehydrogenase (short-subunit alcohol dehydrogenase family)